MKPVLRIVMLVALAAAIAPSIFANPTPPPNVPDGGASALLVTLGAAGVFGVSKFFRKK